MRKLIGSMELALALLLGALAASAQTPAPHIGDVWYGGTTFKKASECTTVAGALGVVFWVNPSDPQHGLVVALKNSANTQPWSIKFDDVASINNITTLNAALSDYAGREHTEILRALPAADYPAAHSISAADWTAGWYLPAFGELRMLYAQYSLVQPSLKSLADLDGEKVKVMDNFGYWSSTEIAKSQAYMVSFSGNNNGGQKNNAWYCRPVRKF